MSTAVGQILSGGGLSPEVLAAMPAAHPQRGHYLKLFGIFVKQVYFFSVWKIFLFQLKLSDAELLDTVLAAKLNAYLAGYKDFAELKRLTADHRLSDQLVRAIEAIAIAGGDSRVCH